MATETSVATPGLRGPRSERIGVVGLGFVGLQVAVHMARVFPTLGFDVDRARIEQLRKGQDRNGEVGHGELVQERLEFTGDPRGLAACDVIIVAVPTPVDKANRPDLGALLGASRTVGEALKARAAAARAAPGGHAPLPIVVYESSVYPGCTEEVCVPALEAASGLRCGEGFKVGYSPERINPGDSVHRFDSIVKVVSGQDAETLDRVAALYGAVVKAGVHRAPDLCTAEAAKVIENTQRDLNIALMNELAMLFHRMGLDTSEVLKAAGTKWNFLRFTPGLVGGHCIPVDPYYLTHKAEELGFFPEVILAGRRINDQMGRWVAQQVVKLHLQRGGATHGARALVLGATFKEDVPDARDTRVVELVRELEEFGLDVRVHDPLLGAERVARLGLKPAEGDPLAGAGAPWDIVVLAVPHREFRERGAAAMLALLPKGKHRGVFADVKGALPAEPFEKAGVVRWVL